MQLILLFFQEVYYQLLNIINTLRSSKTSWVVAYLHHNNLMTMILFKNNQYHTVTSL